MDVATLIQTAMEAREAAYAPYSHYKVGAALITADETVFRGCNIENNAYPNSVCAERTAIYAAMVAGQRDFSAMAIVGGPEGEELDYCFPCGSCRQVMTEFCDGEFEIIVAKNPKDYTVYTLKELLPHYFFLPKK